METSIPNIKGIMICNPPEANKVIKHRRLNNHHHNISKEIPFISASNYYIPIGIPPTVDSNINIKLNRKYANQYLNSITIDYHSTNRKFIHNLYVRKINKINKMKIKDQEIKLKYIKVKESAEDIRHKIRETEPIAFNNTNIKTNSQNLESKSTSEHKSINLPSNKKNGRKRPPWAYTEEQIQLVEDNELDELLKFTEALDFDNYISNLEVLETVDSLQNRIKQIEEEKQLSEDYIKDLENQISVDESNNVEKNELINDMKNHALDNKYNELKVAKELHQSYLKKLDQEKELLEEKVITKKVSNDTLLVSKLKKDKSVRSIHSSASMHALVESLNAPNLAIPNPKIITHEAEKLKVTASNLPYLHRNPAI